MIHRLLSLPHELQWSILGVEMDVPADSWLREVAQGYGNAILAEISAGAFVWKNACGAAEL